VRVIDGPIEQFVPHRGAMSLLDAVTAVADASIESRLTVRGDGLLATADGIPALVAVEYMAQTVAAFGGASARARGEPVQLGLLLGVRNFGATVPFFAPGDVLDVVATLVLESAGGLAVFDCRVARAAETVATARLTVLRIGSLADLHKAIADGATKAAPSEVN
jgi:predicted hotdog family 3-hydroxylacyl-ACP dehydratase